MSALDRAFIKAYAKDIPAAGAPAGRVAPAATAEAELGVGARGIRRAAADGAARIEQVYHDGTLYRVEVPPAGTPRHAGVQGPHFNLPPRSSPHRNVRRSMLRLLEQQYEQEVAQSRELSATHAQTKAAPIIRLLPVAPPAVDLPPEVFDDPRHIEPLPTKLNPATAPVFPPLPQESSRENAPLNLAEQLGPKIEVCSSWETAELADQPAAMIILPGPADLQIVEPAPLVELRLDALPEIDQVVVPPPQPTHRIDEPHAHARRPHVKFAPLPADEDHEPVASEAAESVIERVESRLEEATAATQALADDDLTFADLDPQTADAAIAAAATQESALPLAEPAVEFPIEKSCVPLWEVDQFQWPVAVERLSGDQDGYFAQSSDKLLSAVRGGLKALAITGSRRGEGRTTLALCLARAAAAAGIQVAVIDADFGRPSLAPRIGLDFAHGWQEAALGKIPLSEAAVKSLADSITILPLEAAAEDAGLSLADPRVTATLRAVIATFELVILDLGPLAGHEGALLPAGESCPLDAAIVVRDLRYASLAESQAMGERLYAAGVEAVGIAENFVEEEAAVA